MATKIVRLWVCPNGCGTALEDTGADLTKEVTGNRGVNFEHRPKESWHTRADCPACRTAGKGRVQRVLMNVSIELPAPVKPVEILSEPGPLTAGRPTERPIGVRAA